MVVLPRLPRVRNTQSTISTGQNVARGQDILGYLLNYSARNPHYEEARRSSLVFQYILLCYNISY